MSTLELDAFMAKAEAERGRRDDPNVIYADDTPPEELADYFRAHGVAVEQTAPREWTIGARRKAISPVRRPASVTRVAIHIASRSRSGRATHRQRSKRRAVARASSSRGDPPPDPPDPPPRGGLGEPAHQHSSQARRPKRPSLYIARRPAQVQGCARGAG